MSSTLSAAGAGSDTLPGLEEIRLEILLLALFWSFDKLVETLEPGSQSQRAYRSREGEEASFVR